MSRGSERETKVSDKEELTSPVPDDRDRPYLIVLSGASVGEMYKIATDRTVIGRGNQADLQVLDEGMSRRHAEIVQSDGQILIRDLGSTNGTFCNGKRIVEHRLSDGDKIQVGSTTILKFTFKDSLDQTFQRQMVESALRDGLTKAYNKKYFLDRIATEFAYADRHREPLSLIMFDVDHFKQINDNFGHLAGDYALATLAQVVSDTIRHEDVFARYGGEEFAVICRGIDVSGSLSFAERIRRSVESHAFVYNRARLKVTISLGVAELPERGCKDAEQLIAAADDALYEAKRQGRNRVVSARAFLQS